MSLEDTSTETPEAKIEGPVMIDKFRHDREGV